METERAKIRYDLEKKQAEEQRRSEAVVQAGQLKEQMEKLRLREKEVQSVLPCVFELFHKLLAQLSNL